ncbi:MAG: hypothetical protein Q8L22_11550 [Reyranella sp.]|nr:hypothetical protein [Reyranella sp.]
MAAATGQVSWSGLYYDNIEHLLWNPGRFRGLQSDGKKKTIRMLMERFRTLEAPLHHAVQTFLTLAPDRFAAKLLDIDPAASLPLRIICCQKEEHWRIDERKTISLLELCQPDIFVEGRGVQVAIEIKAKSKSSLEQVLKYAALMSLPPRNVPASAARKLVFLAPYETFGHFWKGKAHADVSSLKDAARNHDDPKLDKKFRRFGTSLDAAKASLDGLEIIWKSILGIQGDVHQELQRVMAEAPSESGEVYCKLLSGFERELVAWPSQ